MTEPDDRAERALRDALEAHANEPDFQPLQLDVAAKPPRRWGRWVPAAAALVLVAVVAVPALLNQNSGGRGPAAAVPADASAERAPNATASADYGSPSATPGWRWESYRVLSYQVPTSWGYGWAPRSSWCGGAQKPDHGAIVNVALWHRWVGAILCPRDIPADQLPMFVTVRAVDAVYRGWDIPAGWAVASTELNGYVLEVVHPDKEARVAADIVASVRPIGDVDPNGCRATASVLDESDVVRPDRVSLCQYDLGAGRQLVASKPLTGNAGQVVVDALRRAPKGSGPDKVSCQVAGDTDVIVRLWKGATSKDVSVRYSGCRGNGLVGLDEPRKLTSEVCHAVMVPPITWTGGFGKAGMLCAPDPTPSAVPTAKATASPTPSR